MLVNERMTISKIEIEFFFIFSLKKNKYLKRNALTNNYENKFFYIHTYFSYFQYSK